MGSVPGRARLARRVTAQECGNSGRVQRLDPDQLGGEAVQSRAALEEYGFRLRVASVKQAPNLGVDECASVLRIVLLVTEVAAEECHVPCANGLRPKATGPSRSLVVRMTQPGASLATDRVDLVDEDDARRLAPGALEQLARTRLTPTPTNISTNSEPEILKNGTFASPATARASGVLSVPG
jgi:hypothetical protein